MRLDRLLAIINLLLNRKRLSAADLAAHFEVSVRTIYRDVEAINAAGIPVVSQAGPRGGFGLMENFQLDRQVFTFKDMVSTLSVLQGVNRAFGDKHIAAAIEKIKTLVPDRLKPQLEFQSEQMAVDVVPWGESAGRRHKLAAIQNALAGNRLLRCTYLNSSGQKRTREIEPMTLVFKGSSWYLFGYCRSKRDFRIFRITRMLRLRVLNRTFERRPASYRDYLEPRPDALPTITLRLRFSPEVRFQLADYMDAELIKTQKDGFSVAEITLPETEWVYSFLLGLGPQAEILAPASVRAGLRARITKISALYSRRAGESRGKAKRRRL